jgi:anti-anti-sigma factor
MDINRDAEGMEFRTREIADVVIYDIKWEFKLIEDIPIALHDDVKSHLNSGKRRFLFNLKNVKYMDSYGLGELVASFISISNVGGKLKLVNLIPRIRLMFEVTGLVKVFEIAEDEKTAIGEFSK